MSPNVCKTLKPSKAAKPHKPKSSAGKVVQPLAQGGGKAKVIHRSKTVAKRQARQHKQRQRQHLRKAKQHKAKARQHQKVLAKGTPCGMAAP